MPKFGLYDDGLILTRLNAYDIETPGASLSRGNFVAY
jgi:hypothetical protein